MGILFAFLIIASDGHDNEARGIGAMMAASAECGFKLDEEVLRQILHGAEDRYPGYAEDVAYAMRRAVERIRQAPPKWRAAHCADMHQDAKDSDLAK